ncbi:MAG: type II secretion system F family protein [Propionibacteriaceae bacterium]|nr:type II secretion system F family protein [Propionibacteriaceae bacterium]
MIAVLFFALAAAVAVGAPAGRELCRLQPRVNRQRSQGIAVVVLSCMALVLVHLVAGPRATGWMLTCFVLVATAAWVVRGARRDHRQARARSETARAARTLALLLQAGQIPAHALRDAAADCPVLASAAMTSRLGGDVGAALHELGDQPGRAGLAKVAAAWRVSERTGAPIAVVLARVAENLRQERHLASVVAAELAAARAGGRIMALLPFVAIGLGTLVGARPLTFLFGSWLGEVALLLGVILACTGVLWTEKVARSGEQTRQRTR